MPIHRLEQCRTFDSDRSADFSSAVRRNASTRLLAASIWRTSRSSSPVLVVAFGMSSPIQSVRSSESWNERMTVVVMKFEPIVTADRYVRRWILNHDDETCSWRHRRRSRQKLRRSRLDCFGVVKKPHWPVRQRFVEQRLCPWWKGPKEKIFDTERHPFRA
jgi:hypothetical protein